MKKYEIHKAMYHYGLVLRALDVIFSKKRKYSKLWVSPNKGFDIYRSIGGSIQQMADEARNFGLSYDNCMEITCCGLLIKPVGWEDSYSVGITEYIEKGGETKIKFYLHYPGITDLNYSVRWKFCVEILPTRTIIKPRLDPHGTRYSQELLALFGDKKSIVIG